MNVAEMKAELKKRGLPCSGVKADLLARIEANDQEQEKSDGPRMMRFNRRGE